MNTEFIFGLMQKNKNEKIRLPLLFALFLIFNFLSQNLQSQTQDIYSSSGVSTWVVPNCVTSVTVEVWGAGGGPYSASVLNVILGTTYNLSVGLAGIENF